MIEEEQNDSAEAPEADARPKRGASTAPGEPRPRPIEERIAEREEKRRRNARERSRWRASRREKRRSDGSGQGTPPSERAGSGKPRVRQGLVVSDKANKTITVEIDIARQHRTYGKIVRTTSTLHAHDERNEANEGDTVRVVESRPLSRTKRWRLVEILDRAR